ncbi:transcriptional regulator [Ruminiclostridium hungatei]|nr:transcriptional regulator [Ruminiclostridium hungatei]
MQKRWVKWIAIILAVVFILTSVVSVGLSIFGGM